MSQAEVCKDGACTGTPIWFDAALLIFVAILLALGATSPTQAIASIEFVGKMLLYISPYLLFAYGLAAYMKASSMEWMITRVFKNREGRMVFAAALFGALSPLCSCTVIPLIAVLLRGGVPLSAVVAFWISSPIISPDMYLYTWAILGFEFATVKLIAAIAMGLISGYSTMSLVRMGFFKNPLKGNQAIGKLEMGPELKPHWKFWKDAERLAIFKKEFMHNALLITKWMAVAFLLESLMMAFVPTKAIGSWVGTQNVWAIPLSVLVGIPAYLNGVAAVPLIHGLITMGMSKPAALGFLVGGSVTSIPAMLAVLPLVSRVVMVWYVLIALITSVLVAYAYQLYLFF